MKYLLSRKGTTPTQIRDDFYFMNDYENVKNQKNSQQRMSIIISDSPDK